MHSMTRPEVIASENEYKNQGGVGVGVGVGVLVLDGPSCDSQLRFEKNTRREFGEALGKFLNQDPGLSMME